MERYPVRAGGATAVALAGDDRVELIDLAGAQTAELTVLALDGREDGMALGVHTDAPATVLRGLAGAPRANGFLGELHARGLKPYDARCIRLFGPDSRRGSVEGFVARRDSLLVVGAPDGGRAIDGDVPGSELELRVYRETPRAQPDEAPLPEPLAEPRLDFRVDPSTALAYEVFEGEHIQVIDVRGKQCSDFLAFHRAKLDAGIERDLDSTATRSMTGRAYPTPGIFGKYFDVDLEPLCEVVRDTVGRHDTFALACTARYYEDLGYPGHANCSDNFNEQLAPYAVRPRQGWSALNFFYNTAFDSDLQLMADEPWSRPGDYVLLKAATDLICASSACPDDIDPSNGWEVTDVHVRVYPPEMRFSVAIAHRATAESEPVLTRDTGFAERTRALSRSMTEYQGFWKPGCFDGYGSVSEYWACRERVAVMDLSALRKWEVLGPDAESLIQYAITRDARKIAVGQVTYTAVCSETGGMLDDATVFRLGQDNFRFVGGCERDGILLAEHAERLGLKRVWIKPSTDELHNVAVQGPRSRELLTSIVWTAPTQTPIAGLRWFRFTVGRIGGPRGIPVVVSRTGYTGELGFEVFCHPSDAVAVWDAIWDAGRPHGLAPLGLDALDVLRVEAALIAADHEFDEGTDPFEAGIGFTVSLEGDEDFHGRAALLERRDHPQRRLAGLLLDGTAEVATHGDPVFVGRERVGVITSGARSPVLAGASIALARLSLPRAEIGTRLELGKLDGHQKRLPAEVVPVPFHDPGRQRIRA